jgi:glycosyltransferase involved in cell wall biosynthesis
MAIRSSEYRSGADVVVGLPVYNGGKYLETALESLIAQEYPLLKIFVSDNASTDETEQIVRSYKARDSRIIYHRMPTNVGSLENFRFVLRETQSEFFMWAAHDDIWPANFVSSAVDCLLDDHNAVMANSTTRLIDENGDDMPDWPSRPQLVDLGNYCYSKRIEAIAERVGWCIYGLMRRSAIEATKVFIDNTPTHDVHLTYQLAAKGTFRVLNRLQPFRYRILPKSPNELAQRLGIEFAKTGKTMTNMFCRCLEAIDSSGKNTSEVKRAKKLFVSVCTKHSEWWSNIKSENGWHEFVSWSLCRRWRLHRLIRNHPASVDNIEASAINNEC